VSPFVDPWRNLSMMTLPAFVLGIAGAAVIVRMTRNTLLEVFGENYVRTARSKGAPQRVVLVRHALRNAMIPVVTVAGLQLGYLLGGAVLVEEVFSLPGVGRLLLQGIAQRDYPVVQACVLVLGLLFMLINLMVDLLYVRLDPRISLR
jgi:peptide/nickel transport system permease protein